MITPEQLQTLKDLTSTAQSILILVSPQVTLDGLAAALSLFRGFEAQGKNATFGSPLSEEALTQLQQKYPDLSGITQIQTQLGNKMLQVTFEYVEESVEKVSYNIDEEQQKFHLTIQPQKGHKPLDASKVQFSYAGVDADLIFVVGTRSVESLEHFYEENTRLFEETTVVSLNMYETSYGTVKLSTDSVSLSESMAFLLQELEVMIDSDMATNLLAGIEEITQGFRSLSTTAETFEIVSKLLRLGGRRIYKAKVVEPSSGFTKLPEGKSSDSVSLLKNSGDVDQESVNGFVKALQKAKNQSGLVEEMKNDDAGSEKTALKKKKTQPPTDFTPRSEGARG